MYRAREYYSRYAPSDPMTRLIAIVALVFLLILALPRLIPGTASGVDCGGMPIPRASGSNQSLLSSQIDPSALHLELAPDHVIINQGQPLDMEVRFINESVAPIVLFYDPVRVTFRYTEQEAGILFSIQTPDGRALGVPPNVRLPYPVLQSFAPDQLRILAPRSRCNVRVEIDPATLNAAQVIRGDYRVTAVYRNPSRGALPAPGPLTPTPVFRDQGVWTGQVQSNDILVTVGLPTQPPS